MGVEEVRGFLRDPTLSERSVSEFIPPLWLGTLALYWCWSSSVTPITQRIFQSRSSTTIGSCLLSWSRPVPPKDWSPGRRHLFPSAPLHGGCVCYMGFWKRVGGGCFTETVYCGIINYTRWRLSKFHFDLRGNLLKRRNLTRYWMRSRWAGKKIGPTVRI